MGSSGFAEIPGGARFSGLPSLMGREARERLVTVPAEFSAVTSTTNLFRTSLLVAR